MPTQWSYKHRISIRDTILYVNIIRETRYRNVSPWFGVVS